MIAATTREAARRLRPVLAGMATIALVAVWIGLTVGFLDAGLLIFEKRSAGETFLRVGNQFVWIIPVGVCLLLLVPALVLILITGVRRGRAPLGMAVGTLSFLGFLDLTARMPLELWSSLLLCGGLAVQSARLARRREELFMRFVRRTTPYVAGGFLTVMLFSLSARVLSEYWAMFRLPAPPPGAKNVLLIVWDTVRAANLSLHGYSRPTSPHLERFAANGVRFEQVFATAPWTLPSHSGLFTGRWPHELKADWQRGLDGTYPTLAEFLAAHGYDTAGFVANLDYCSRETGLARGFEHYEDYPIELLDIVTRYIGLGSRFDLLAPASVINRYMKPYLGESFDVVPRAKEHAKNAAMVEHSFLNWLSWQRGRDRPFFAFLNLNDAHTPYEVPDRSVPGFGLRPTSYWDRLTMKQWEALDKKQVPSGYVQMATDLYDDNIAYLDRRLNLLLEDLARRKLLDDTLVIVTADHGEHIGDHSLFFHGCSLYRQLVGVPLVIVNSSAVPMHRVIAEPVSLRDIPATVADLVGLAPASPFPGRSLARLWSVGQKKLAGKEEPLLMEVDKPPVLTNQGREPVAKGPMQAVVSEGMHYIRRGDGVEELYDLNTDQAERTDVVLYPRLLEVLERLRASLSDMLEKRQH